MLDKAEVQALGRHIRQTMAKFNTDQRATGVLIGRLYLPVHERCDTTGP
ncbi:hypothetical protein ACQP08_09170 [Micromonospora zamorensis]